MTEPVELADIKTHLRLDPSSTDEDDYLEALIIAARRACEARINRSVVGFAATATFDDFPRAYAPAWSAWLYMPVEIYDPRRKDVPLSGGSVSSVDAVTYYDTAGTLQTLATDGYMVDLAETPARIAPVGDWPEVQKGRPGAVSVQYSVAPMDDDDLAVVAHAMRLLIGGWYRNRESVQVDKRGMAAEIPNTVGWLLDPLRKWASS
jgi:hypothetical protein